MHTETETFDQHLFLSKSEAAIHYGSHYHRQRSFHNFFNAKTNHGRQQDIFYLKIIAAVIEFETSLKTRQMKWAYWVVKKMVGSNLGFYALAGMENGIVVLRIF